MALVCCLTWSTFAIRHIADFANTIVTDPKGEASFHMPGSLVMNPEVVSRVKDHFADATKLEKVIVSTRARSMMRTLALLSEHNTG